MESKGMITTKKITLNLNTESLEKLEAIKESKFRPGTDTTKAIRWLIDDEFDRIKSVKEIG